MESIVRPGRCRDTCDGLRQRAAVATTQSTASHGKTHKVTSAERLNAPKVSVQASKQAVGAASQATRGETRRGGAPSRCLGGGEPLMRLIWSTADQQGSRGRRFISI